MVKNYQAKIALLGVFAVLTTALPQPATHATAGVVGKVVPSEDPDASAPIDLPFLQFKNGGIRVNFAGYHAEAGLGGLLGGSDAKGGLYASAGTPWGPSASAGLGGSLGGQDGTARGGLHARAGLGNGRPEAAAGLSGALDGSGRSKSKATGGLFAGATTGGSHEASAGLGGSVGGNSSGSGATGSSFAAATDGKKTKLSVKEVSHIQPIAPSAEKVYLAKSGPKEATTTLEFKIPAHDSKKDASASSLVVAANPGPKYEISGGVNNGVLAATDAHEAVDQAYPARRYYRKRLREGSPFRKNFYKFFTTNDGPVADSPAVSASANVGGGIVTRQANDDHVPAAGHSYVPYGTGTRTKGTTLFDDIFNIPISALTAVNQLLNNKSG